MVNLPGGFSPKRAVQQFGSLINPTGGLADYDVFSNLGRQRGGQYQGIASLAGGLAGSLAPTNNRQIPRSPGNQGEDQYNYGGGTGSGGASADDLAYLDDQESRLRRQLQSALTTRSQGLKQLGDSYNQEVSKTNQQRSRALEDFGVKREDTQRGKDSALGKVDTNARTLADSVRRILGMASGASSSAYQFAAPNAIARQASQQRGSVLGNFGENFRDLDTAEERAKIDFEDLLSDLAAQRKTRESEFRAGVLGQEQDINESLAEVARQRALAQGGGYGAVRSATAPYVAQIDDRQRQIDSLFDRFRTPYSVKPVQVDIPELRDYTVDRAAINAQRSGQADEYAPYRRKFTDEEAAI